MHKLIKTAFLATLFIILLFTSWPMIKGNINFHTDIARDFMLLEDVYYNQNITLIGPRSGGIPGVFHGPMWLYLNLPAFIVGDGNPVAVGWFWVAIFAASTAVVYEVTRRMFDVNAAMIASLVYASSVGGSVYAFFNPAGAVILFPLFFYLLWLFFQKNNHLVLGAAMFVLGCIIQFQMAFGGPLLVLIVPYLIYHTIRTKQYINLLMMLVILVPLSSFILFDIRHDFLQVRSVLNYLNGVENTGKVDIPLRDLVYQRLELMLNDTIGMISYNTVWLTILAGFAIFTAIVQKVKKIHVSDPYVLFLAMLVGYWVITMAYEGVMWGYYFWPFVGLIAIFFGASYKYLNRYVFAVLFLVLMANNMQVLFWKTVDLKETQGSWVFFKEVAERAFDIAPAEFGYYVYTTDQFGYSTRYAMSYLNRQNDDQTAIPDQKRQTTLLMIDDPGTHEFTNSVDWRLYDVRIEKEPVQEIPVTKSYRIETFELTDEEQQVESNPYMLNSLIFR